MESLDSKFIMYFLDLCREGALFWVLKKFDTIFDFPPIKQGPKCLIYDIFYKMQLK